MHASRLWTQIENRTEKFQIAKFPVNIQQVREFIPVE